MALLNARADALNMEPAEPNAPAYPLDMAGPAGPPPSLRPEPEARGAVPRWVVIVTALALFAVLLGGSFVAGWVVRGPGGGERAPAAVPTSCSAASILGVVRDWSAASDRYEKTAFGSAEGDQAFDELYAQEKRLHHTLTRGSQ